MKPLRTLFAAVAVASWSLIGASAVSAEDKQCAIDPFNGKELMYTLVGVDKRSYTLLSIGPPVRDDNGNIKPGERVPFAVMK